MSTDAGLTAALAVALGGTEGSPEDAYLRMARAVLPKLVKPLAIRLHEVEHADHLASTGCRLDHIITARLIVGEL